MNNGEKLQSLENKVMLLQYELEVIKSIVSSNSCSNASSLEKAYRKGFRRDKVIGFIVRPWTAGVML